MQVIDVLLIKAKAKLSISEFRSLLLETEELLLQTA